ncbi:ABC transporter substrate-binding protein [Limobrevibacterium gyesilva]|uniref:ABC transporter substrate-binding protein n=1 Tax=Limobrevibacterium gyesilva TaxID=2991712 RepID=A0AA42CEJ3_9PROT|nr:ABC transporter substrate-binding protein [Limobrevibacterium gyesilva]MCW3475354.1 ABC transporter substrate-binding protein [Limobrevibacterium gyesilva]
MTRIGSRTALAALAVMLPFAVGLPTAAAQTLEIATDQSPVGLDPHVATAFSTALIDSNIYEGLTAVDTDLRTVPSLAESWTVSPDGLTYVFRLRAGATFHNGRAVTPQDIIANIERVRDPKTASPFASRFTGIKGMEAVGANELRLTLDAPSAPLLSQLATLAIVAPEAAATLGRVPVGTGPFRFKEWVPDTYITLERNPAYWEKGLPYLGGLKFNIVPESATREAGIASGTYRLMPVVDAAAAAALAGKPGVRLLQTQDLAYSLIGLNTSKAPFDKPAVREAFNLAIDRAQLVQAVYFGRGVPGGPLSPALTQWALPVSAFPCYTPDAAAAQKKLQEAGITGKLKVTLNVLGSLQQVVDVAQVVQAQLNKAGFDVQLNVQEQGKFIADWRASNFEGFVSLNSGSPDPDDYFGRAFQTGGATNVYKYSNPDLDKLLIAARAETDPKARKQLYDGAQRILACTGPAIDLAYGTLFAAVRGDVQGFTPMATRSLRTLREAKIAP